MNYKEILTYIPEIMRVLRMMMALFLTFDYPIAGKCLLLMVCVEIAVGRLQYNKKRAVVLDLILIYLNLAGSMSYIKVNIFIFVALILLSVELVVKVIQRFSDRVDIFKKLSKVLDINIKKRYVALGVITFLICAFVLAVTPYSEAPKVSEAYKETFDVNKFYSDEVCCDRATIIDDNGEALARRINLIENAKEEIVMSTFSFISDTAGKQVITALREAAKRGVKVRILIDGFNSIMDIEGNPYFMALAEEENVTIKIYNEANIFTSWKAMSRMHDKYIIADDEVYILGGRNTFNYFLGDQNSHKNHDRDVLVYNTGDQDSSIYELRNYFEGVWNLDVCHEWNEYLISGLLPSVNRARSDLEEIYKDMKEKNGEWFEEPDYESITVATDKVTLLSNPTDIYMKEPWVFYGLCQLMAQADEEVVIHTPYIIADETMYQAFTDICKNVDVKVMTNAPVNNGNMFGAVDYVIHKQQILDTGLNVLEYNGGISYHAKSMTIDEDISIVGSFNMDYKSMYHDTELMLVIDSVELNAILKASHESYEKDAVEAEVQDNELGLMLQQKNTNKKIQGTIIRFLDPYVRFLF